MINNCDASIHHTFIAKGVKVPREYQPYFLLKLLIIIDIKNKLSMYTNGYTNILIKL